MKCIVCNGSNIEPQKVDEQIRSGEDIVLLSMKVPVCLNCGERYYDREKMKRIEKIRDRIRIGDLQAEQVGKVFRTRAA